MQGYETKLKLPANLSLENMSDLPKIFIGTPWSVPYIPAAFTLSLRNMLVPLPHVFDFVAARHVVDARNAIVKLAIDNNFDFVMMLDADQSFPSNFFIELWKIVQQDPENNIATGWAIIKTGKYAGKTSVCKWKNGDFYAEDPKKVSIRKKPFQTDGFGTCGFLCSTKIFKRLTFPWFTDINIICEENRLGQFYVATEFAMGQDLCFSIKAKEVGARLICHPKMKMPHQVLQNI